MTALEIITTAASVVAGALLTLGTLVVTCLIALGLLWVLVAAVHWIPPFLDRAYNLARRILGITSPSQSPEIRAAIQAARLDLVAAAIAEAAGHNWAADMMPGYRAEFRRQARAAIAAIHEAAR